MAEYIEREAAIGALRRRLGPNTSPAQKNMIQLAAIDIRSIKAADVAQVRHGRWIKRGYSCGENEYECSVCHETEWRTSASRMKYCTFCGAKMGLKEGEDFDQDRQENS